VVGWVSAGLEGSGGGMKGEFQSLAAEVAVMSRAELGRLGRGISNFDFLYPTFPFCQLQDEAGIGALGFPSNLAHAYLFEFRGRVLISRTPISGVRRANWFFFRGRLGPCLWEYWLGVVRKERGQVCSVEGLGALSCGRFRRLQQCQGPGGGNRTRLITCGTLVVPWLLRTE
jgi:hypothetical protein